MSFWLEHYELTSGDILRFRANLGPVQPNGCQLWIGGCDAYGYGRMSVGGYQAKAHHIAWKLSGRVFPDGLVVDHLCQAKTCQTVAHFDWVTVGENMHRYGVRSTMCQAGLHRWDDPASRYHTAKSDAKRECRLCRMNNRRARAAERRQARG